MNPKITYAEHRIEFFTLFEGRDVGFIVPLKPKERRRNVEPEEGGVVALELLGTTVKVLVTHADYRPETDDYRVQNGRAKKTRKPAEVHVQGKRIAG